MLSEKQVTTSQRDGCDEPTSGMLRMKGNLEIKFLEASSKLNPREAMKNDLV